MQLGVLVDTDGTAALNLPFEVNLRRALGATASHIVTFLAKKKKKRPHFFLKLKGTLLFYFLSFFVVSLHARITVGLLLFCF